MKYLTDEYGVDFEQNNKAIRYYGIVVLLYTLFSLSFILNGKAELSTVLFQSLILYISFGFFVFFQHRPLNSSEVYLDSVLYATLTSIIFLGLDFVDRPNDSFFYASKGLIVANSEYDIFTALAKYVSDQSDWGGLAFTALGYILGGEEYGPFFSALLKILLYSWACVLIYKLFDTIFENKEWIKIILGLVAFNSYVPYFATAGLKELVFAFVVVGAVYYVYSVLRNPSLVNFLLFALFAISTFFFRAIFPIYFVAAYIICRFAMSLMTTKVMTIAIIALFLLVVLGAGFLQEKLPFIAGGIQERLDMERNSSGFKYLNVINAFISPYPAVAKAHQPVNLFNFQYEVVNSSFALFGLLGIYHSIKNELVDLYPTLIVLLANSLMLITVGFAMNARYTFPTIFCLYAFVPLGLAYSFERKWIVSYLSVILAITFLYNMR